MGVLSNICAHLKEYDEIEKERKSKLREEKKRLKEEQLENQPTPKVIDDDSGEVIEGIEEEDSPTLQTIDYFIVKDYVVPTFVIKDPNPKVGGATTKFNKRFGRYLAFIDCVKYYRSSKYCSILALATTAKTFLDIWESEQRVSDAFRELSKIGLIKIHNDYYQTGMCRTYYYFIENEKRLIEYCREHNIQKHIVKNEQILSKQEKNELVQVCEKSLGVEFKGKVLFKSRLKLDRPANLKPTEFKKYVYECLYENYPGFKIYQQIASTINETFYADQEEFRLKFRPTFHWNENKGKKKGNDKKSIVGIGIRVSNKLCGAKKDNNVSKDKKKIFRAEVLKKYGLEFEKDITSSIAKITYGLNFGGWLKDDVDLYKKIYEEYNPGGIDFAEERDAIKKLFFRTYFDSTDNKLGYHTWKKMTQNGVDKNVVYTEMAKLRRAMEEVLGPARYDNFIFLRSHVYIDVLHTLLTKGYKVWIVFDCFYGKGVGTQEQFEKLVVDAVYICFIRFKMALDYNDWENILKI